MDSQFDGKVVFITGAGAGIGRFYAREFAAQGASLVVTDLVPDAAAALADELTADGHPALALTLDVSNDEQIVAAVSAATERFGGIDVLINNAGIHLGHAQLPYELDEMPHWRKVLEVNVIGALACAVAARPAMRGREGASIINHSSMAAYGASGAYGVSKMALNSLTLSLANEFGSDGIRVNGIAPGLVDSEAAVEYFNEPERQGVSDQLVASQVIKRPGTMRDLANAAKFLASPEASFVTGQTLLVDGGFTRRL